jgi:hypothetical protein
MKGDRHKEAIPASIVKQVHDQIEAVKTALAPYMLALTPQERQNILKMGDKSLAFVGKTHDYAGDNPTLVPSFLDMDEFDKDFSDAHRLWRLLTATRQLEEMVEDTIMVAGSEAYHAALAVYHNIQAAAKQDIPGAKAIYEDLKTRFPGGKKRGDGTDAETETD